MHRRSLLKSIATIAAGTGLLAASKAHGQSNGPLLTPPGKNRRPKNSLRRQTARTCFTRIGVPGDAFFSSTASA